MATDTQIAANRENAQYSTGPKTDAGKANSCKNNTRWGFAGSFFVLPSEDQQEFDSLQSALYAEHRPQTPTEEILVGKMAQAVWLSRRAQILQDAVLAGSTLSLPGQNRQFALYLRYQTANDRAFQRCLHDLLKLRAETRKAEIGFEREKRERERADIRQAAEKRKQDRHEYEVLLAQAKYNHQEILNSGAARTVRAA